jgi:DNA-binding response OmpR family regulator
VLIVCAMLDFGLQDFIVRLRGDARMRDVPVIALVERESELDAGAARDWGLDDLILEPVTPEQFIRRVRASLEQSAGRAAAAHAATGLSLDRERGFLRRGTRSVVLGPKERQLMAFFLEHPGQVLPRDLLLFRVWGGVKTLQSRVLDVSVCRLRSAMEQLGCAELIQTVSRHGYRFGPPVESRELPRKSPADPHSTPSPDAHRA